MIVEVDTIYFALCFRASRCRFVSFPGGKYGEMQASLIYEYYGSLLKNGINFSGLNLQIASVG